MENLNQFIEHTKDDNLIFVKNLVDDIIFNYGQLFNIKYSLEERNELIIKVIRLVEKHYIAPNHPKWETEKKLLTNMIIKSCIANKSVKDKKNLENPQ